MLLLLGAGSDAQTCVPPPAGITAWWPFDEAVGPIASDIAGQQAGSHAGRPVAIPGRVGRALRFNGAPDHVAAADNDLWAFGRKDFTIELWANFGSPGGGGVTQPSHIFIGNDEGPGSVNKWFFALGGGFLNFHINAPALGPQFFPLVRFTPELNRWYHLAVTRAGNLYTIYIDGISSGTATNAAAIADAAAPLTIGQAENLGHVRGSLDEVTLYGRALSPAELQSIVAAGAGGKCKSVFPASMLLSPAGLTFRSVVGGGAPPPRSFRILNAGTGLLPWSVTASTVSGGNWLDVSPASGSSDADRPALAVEVRANVSRLAAGEYYGLLRAASASASNSPQFVSVVLSVSPPQVNPGPVVEPAGLILVGVRGGAAPAPQAFRIANLTAGLLTFTSTATFTGAPNWFTQTPAAASVAPGQPLSIAVAANASGLAAGVYTGAISLRFSDNSTRRVELILVITPAGTASLVAASGDPAQARCTATRLLPLFSLLGANFTSTAGWPTPVQVLAVDDCGIPLTAGSVVVAFSNNDPALSLASLGDGQWAGTWAPRNARTPDITLAALAQSPDRSIEGRASIGGGVQANPDVPLVGSGGVVSAASFAAGVAPAPGAFVAIFGTGLADGLGQSSRLPLENRLQGAEVTLAGRLLPLLFASDLQINAQVPYDVPFNARHQLIVRRGNRLSIPEALTVAPAQPAVFSTSATGRGQGHIYRATAAGEQILAAAATPVSAGDVIVIYCGGLGAVTPALESGAAAPTAFLTRTTGPL